MNRPHVDPQTALTIHALLHKCATEGRDPIRALDELGHLNFPALEEHQLKTTLGSVAAVLNMLSLDTIVKVLTDRIGQPRRQPMTPHETKQLIVDWLLTFAEDPIKPTQKEKPTQ